MRRFLIRLLFKPADWIVDLIFREPFIHRSQKAVQWSSKIFEHTSGWLIYLVMPLAFLCMVVSDFTNRQLLCLIAVWTMTSLLRNAMRHQDHLGQIGALNTQVYHLREKIFPEDVEAEERRRNPFYGTYHKGDPPPEELQKRFTT